MGVGVLLPPLQAQVKGLLVPLPVILGLKGIGTECTLVRPLIVRIRCLSLLQASISPPPTDSAALRRTRIYRV